MQFWKTNWRFVPFALLYGCGVCFYQSALVTPKFDDRWPILMAATLMIMISLQFYPWKYEDEDTDRAAK